MIKAWHMSVRGSLVTQLSPCKEKSAYQKRLYTCLIYVSLKKIVVLGSVSLLISRSLTPLHLLYRILKHPLHHS